MTTTKARTTAAEPKRARWRCLIEPCPTRGSWQDAPHEAAAGAGWRRHYLAAHWERP
ncbi:hypothetical protein ACWCSD_34520 [Nonomuraea sp. NPDC001684]